MPQPLNRSFARRIGKSLSTLQKDAITLLLPQFLLKPSELNHSALVVEIGIGMGEHFISQAQANPHLTYIGFEPYLNGIANALLMAEKEKIDNIRLWPDDMDLAFSDLPDKSLEAIYILFPDPWPKNKQKKRRIVCKERLDLFIRKLKKNGILYFASDIEDYVKQTQKLLKACSQFTLQENIQNIPHEGYVQTKYHAKAEAEGRKAVFLSAFLQ